MIINETLIRALEKYEANGDYGHDRKEALIIPLARTALLVADLVSLLYTHTHTHTYEMWGAETRDKYCKQPTSRFLTHLP